MDQSNPTPTQNQRETRRLRREAVLSLLAALHRFVTGERRCAPPTPTIDDLVERHWPRDQNEPTRSAPYADLLCQFEEAEGYVERQYWGVKQPLCLVLTERPRNVVKRWLHRPPVMHLHRSTLRLQEVPSSFQAALNEGDMLAVRANWSLGDLSRHTVMDRIFEAEVFLLRIADQTGLALPPDELRAALDHYLDQLYRIQIELNTAAVRRARYSYTFGALAGLVVFGLVATVCAVIASALGHSVHEAHVAVAFGCATAGAFGAAASVSWKAASGSFKIDPAAGIAALPRIAMQRPGIGAIFGLAVYFALKSGFIRIGQENENFYFFGLFSFIAGFSDRLLPDLVRRAEGQFGSRATSDPVDAPDGVDADERRLHPS